MQRLKRLWLFIQVYFSSKALPEPKKTPSRAQLVKELEPGLNALFGLEYDRYDPKALPEPKKTPAIKPEVFCPKALPEPKKTPAIKPEVFRPKALPEPKKTPAIKPEVSPEFGEFYFRHTILDQLDRYFIILNRMRHADKDAFRLYSQLGAYILPEKNTLDQPAFFKTPTTDLFSRDDSKTLDPEWVRTRPAFGMVMYGTRSDSVEEDKSPDYYVPFAVYFTKFNKRRAPNMVQRFNSGDVYMCVVYWDTFKKKDQTRFSTEFALGVSPDGDVSVLKILENKRITIRAKKGRSRGSTFTVPRKEWGIPAFFKKWALEHKVDTRDFLSSLFIETANAQITAANAMVKVKVSKGRVSAVFGVNILRTPYFFKDRELCVGPKGKKKKIFHIVRTHIRKSGSVVRTHFRGVRHFNWNGYRIRITVPGWHHLRSHEFDGSAIDPEDADNLSSYVDQEELGKILVGYEDSSVGAFVR